MHWNPNVHQLTHDMLILGAQIGGILIHPFIDKYTIRQSCYPKFQMSSDQLIVRANLFGCIIIIYIPFLIDPKIPDFVGSNMSGHIWLKNYVLPFPGCCKVDYVIFPTMWSPLSPSLLFFHPVRYSSFLSQSMLFRADVLISLFFGCPCCFLLWFT